MAERNLQFIQPVIRGTPMLVQLLIMYYIIFAAAPTEMAPYVAALAFGINSGAYVSRSYAQALWLCQGVWRQGARWASQTA